MERRMHVKLTNAQYYYLRQLLLTLIIDIIPAHQTVDKENKMNYSDLNLSFTSEDERNLINSQFRTDRNLLVQEFIGKVLGQKKR